ncbi:hypothetical protein [Halochromatium salexigens]|nr:hypothetical protein [Halochromatium salexigens]
MRHVKKRSRHEGGTRAWRLAQMGVRAVRGLYPGYGVVGLVPPVLIVALMLALLLWGLSPREAGA